MKLDVLPSKNSLLQVHNSLLIPATYALQEVEHTGFKINVPLLKQMDKDYQNKIKYLEDSIRSYPEVIALEKETNAQFNVNSSEQLRNLLYGKLGLSDGNNIPLTDKGKLSCNKEAIKRLKGTHELISYIEQHKKYSTLYKMFISPILKTHLAPDGKVHSSYLLHGTVTGRLSSQNPNVQQIPRNVSSEVTGFEFDESLNIKLLFVPSSSDNWLLDADYSQMELRVLAEYSQDEAMINVFSTGEDIHLNTARKIANDPNLSKDSPLRTVAKQINFGIVYGKSAESLSHDLGISIAKAKQFIDTYFSAMPKVKTFIEYAQQFVLDNKYITSMFGRSRKIDFNLDESWSIGEALRKAVNTPIQSTASDYALSSLINLTEFFIQHNLKSRVVATVHDSIVLDVPKVEFDMVAKIVKTIMENPQNSLIYWGRNTPFEAELKYGECWGITEKLK